MERPELHWNCDEEKLYTVLLMDNDGIPEGNEYFNWVVHDIPGCNVADGKEALGYLPPFRVTANEDRTAVDKENPETTPFILLVYEQSGPIEFPKEQKGCNKDLFGPNRAWVRV